MNVKALILIGVLCSNADARSIKHLENVILTFPPSSSVVAASSVRSLSQTIDRAAQKCPTWGIEVIALEAVIDPMHRMIAMNRNASLRTALVQLGAPPGRIYGETFDARRPPSYVRDQVPTNAVQVQLVCTPG
ncbi:hypothetical protein J2W27_000010 [Variovorax boronicumulans]|uniref:hypothetical protein n=1 Tax=Variovorax boronicumulans TaxID=436515 RepID=UPI00277F6374|nr:hypothetical protein [Variovorax boronicumulans]MDP9907917.1 hypothetical protein [Variovorax boronicumulans]